jgi:ferric-dicitrate binding protein FerR (iron transport regulator)
MEQPTPYALIAKYLSSQCSDIEELELLAWRKLSTENELLFEELRNEWNLINADLQKPPVYPNKEKVWSNIQQSIKTTVNTYTRSFVIRIASMAAMIALVIGFSFSYLLNDTKEAAVLSSTFIAPNGQKSQLVLADGTKVWLNSGSSLTYSNKYGDKDRSVQLKGEAFFDVTKNPNLKFIVNTGSINVVVHGTAFNVKSYGVDPEVSVSLLRGKVDVVSAIDNMSLALLSPGERVVLDKKGMNFKVEKCDASLDGIWRLEKLKFEGATISEVAQKLGKWYGIDIAVKDTNRFQKYWFTVKSESLLDILKSMNGLHPIKYSISGDYVLISSR